MLECNLPKTLAGDFVADHGVQGVIIIVISQDGSMEYHTAGENTTKSNVLATWMSIWFLRAFTAIPFRTHFGWGNQGKPQPATEAEIATLNEAGRKWAETWFEADYVL